MAYVGVKPAGITSATEAEIAGDLTVDTSTLHVDAANNRVGVGTLTPADHLAVVTSGANAQLSVDRSDGATGRTVLIHSTSGGQLQTTGSVPLIFGTADTERGRFLAGGGLTFNGDTAAANALDDYEEGTWTPAYATSGQAFSSLSYHNQHGRYVKVGKQVHAWFYLATNALTKGSASGSVVVTGLPYTVENVDYQTGSVGYSSTWVTNHPTALLGSYNQTQIFFYHSNGSTAHVNTSPSNMVDHSGNNKHLIYGALSYRSA